MKYVVDVNAKWLVNIEATSCANAENQIFDLDGVWGATAYEMKSVATQDFAVMVQFREFISMDELRRLSDKYKDAWFVASNALDAQARLGREVERLQELLNKAQIAEQEAQKHTDEALAAARETGKEMGHTRLENAKGGC